MTPCFHDKEQVDRNAPFGFSGTPFSGSGRALPRPAAVGGRQGRLPEGTGPTPGSPDRDQLPPDSAELSARERRRLETFLEDPSHADDLCVIAQSESFGDSEYNEALARKRTETVVKALRESGLKATAVTLRPGDSREMTYHAMERRILILDTE
ncbi:OmpA family protein [Fodinicurvata halophila]|uniref:hypothetical protein n=1 Tax=Fodinicurvata halophila TaxID=1419723 RepID=UPI003626EE06